MLIAGVPAWDAPAVAAVLGTKPAQELQLECREGPGADSCPKDPITQCRDKPQRGQSEGTAQEGMVEKGDFGQGSKLPQLTGNDVATPNQENLGIHFRAS